MKKRYNKEDKDMEHRVKMKESAKTIQRNTEENKMKATEKNGQTRRIGPRVM